MAPTDCNPRRSGFTLVELLVVIGIVVVLISLLLPAVNLARRQADRLKCGANLHSIGQAMILYTQQYNYYPGAWCGGSSGTGYVWPVRLRALLGGEQRVFDCPSQDERCRWTRSAPATAPRATGEYCRYGYEMGEPLLSAIPFYFSYGYNVWGTTQYAGLGLGADVRKYGPKEGSIRASAVKMPSDMIAVADSDADGIEDLMLVPFKESFAKPGTVHRGGANVLFCDGHVTWYRQSELLVGSSLNPAERPNRRRWNNDHTDG